MLISTIKDYVYLSKRKYITGKIYIVTKVLILETEIVAYHFRTTFAGMNISDGFGVIWA